MAQVERKRGNVETAIKLAKTALKYDKRGIDLLFHIALDKGDSATAETLMRQIEGFSYGERGSRVSPRPMLFIRCYFSLKTGHADEAIGYFKEVLSHRPQTWSLDPFEDCLANAYLDLGRYDEAATEYERIISSKPYYPLVHYHLAQAFEHLGRLDEANDQYQLFLQSWKDADADIPEVIAARHRLSL